jgi:hypothetical protein
MRWYLLERERFGPTHRPPEIHSKPRHRSRQGPSAEILCGLMAWAFSWHAPDPYYNCRIKNFRECITKMVLPAVTKSLFTSSQTSTNRSPDSHGLAGYGRERITADHIYSVRPHASRVVSYFWSVMLFLLSASGIDENAPINSHVDDTYLHPPMSQPHRLHCQPQPK